MQLKATNLYWEDYRTTQSEEAKRGIYPSGEQRQLSAQHFLAYCKQLGKGLRATSKNNTENTNGM